MILKNTSFDAVITDSLGKMLKAECKISEPLASGQPADISIQLHIKNKSDIELENPCSLHSKEENREIELKDVWYRSISTNTASRTYPRAAFEIHHIGQLIIRFNGSRQKRKKVIFNLSPIRFFQENIRAEIVDYSNTPNMEVELFKLNTIDLGDIRFIKYWSIHHTNQKGIAAKIHASFAAEINWDESSSISALELSNKIKDVLIPLSVLTRQAITLHGWQWQEGDCIETIWITPLKPNLAPDMALEPIKDLCLTKEFQSHAQVLVEKFLASAANLKEAVTLLSVALAPHIEKSTSANFLALFSALEQVLALEKLSDEEKSRLKETDNALVSELLNLKSNIESKNEIHADIVAARIIGLIEIVKNSSPSFKVKLDKFLNAYPSLNRYMSDLWPILGTRKKPGLKQIRDSLAHGLRQEYNTQAIAVAHWHFARLAERLIFILLDAEVPKGIELGSSYLTLEFWHGRIYWQSIQTEAKKNSI